MIGNHATPYWAEIEGPGRIGTMPRPLGGVFLAEAMTALKDSGVDVLVSALTRMEMDWLELEHQAEEAQNAGIEFINFPITDRTCPKMDGESEAFVRRLHGKLLGGASIATHCYAGIGRSTLLAAAVMILNGLSADEAIARISLARGLNVPDTNEQMRWLQTFERYHGARD